MDEASRSKLLRVARGVVEAVVRGERPPPVPRDRIADTISRARSSTESGGAFVTLRNAGRLRGCMGTFRPTGDLEQTVAEVAESSAKDPRFVADPVTPAELSQLRVEVSVLSPWQRTDDPLSLEVGTHGIYIRRGARSGCFLPQVATEQGWDKIEFLDRCCELKAGLPAGSWREPETDVYLFTSEVFSESGFHETVAGQESSSSGPSGR